MAYEKKNGDFVLFPNNNKTKDNQPDWRGTIRFDGKDYEIAAWGKTSGNGNKYMSGNMGKEKEEQQKSSGGWSNHAPKPQAAKIDMPFDDDIPFK